jgi:GTP-binding protein
MIFQKTQFLMSCATHHQIPPTPSLRIAFWGRSNVGKSSLLNSLIGKHKARVSKTPGRTQLINLFECPSPLSIWCDLPGYGYASINHQDSEKIGTMLEEYFLSDKLPNILCWLLDARHNLTKTDFEILPFIASLDLELIIVTTKNDKFSNQQALKQKKLLEKQLEALNLKPKIFPISSLNKTGLLDLEEYLLTALSKDQCAPSQSEP